MIAILCTMEAGVAALRNRLAGETAHKVASWQVFSGTIGRYPVVIGSAGENPQAVRDCVQGLLRVFRPEKLIHLGTARTLLEILEPGTVAIADRVTAYRSEGISPVQDYYVCDGYLGLWLGMALRKKGEKVFPGNCLSGLRYVKDAAMAREIWSEYRTVCADRVSAALGETAVVNGVYVTCVNYITGALWEGPDTGELRNTAVALLASRLGAFLETETI